MVCDKITSQIPSGGKEDVGVRSVRDYIGTMKRNLGIKALALPLAAALVLGGVSAAALAQKAAPKGDAKTPSGWSYDIKDGKRVPKAKRQVNADGSWKETVERGSCVTIREKTKDGEFRETQEC